MQLLQNIRHNSEVSSVFIEGKANKQELPKGEILTHGICFPNVEIKKKGLNTVVQHTVHYFYKRISFRIHL